MIPLSTSQTRVPSLFSLSILYYKFPHPPLLKVPPPPSLRFPIPSSLLAHASPDTDLALRFLCLGGVMVVGRLTVRAVVFTVVIGCPGVCHYQQLLDVSLQRRKGDKKTHQWNPLHISWGWILNGKEFLSTCNVFIESDSNQKKKKWIPRNNSIGEPFFVLF